MEINREGSRFDLMISPVHLGTEWFDSDPARVKLWIGGKSIPVTSFSIGLGSYPTVLSMTMHEFSGAELVTKVSGYILTEEEFTGYLNYLSEMREIAERNQE